ncbi:MAG: HEAT repeat domain-containing protein [Candidatus Aminicenantes bacterium]|jgi:HEAT repeat protein
MRETNKKVKSNVGIILILFLFGFFIGCVGNKSEKAVESIILALQDENSSVREAAAEALGAIKSERSVDLLIQALKDKIWYVRQKAAYALGKIYSKVEAK